MDKDIRICSEYSNEELYEIIKEREKKMPDREKIIKALERCTICDMSVIASDRGKQAYYDCEYTTGLYCRQDKVIADALALLKGQEAVSITTDYFDGFGNRTSHCPSCNSRLVWHQNKNYCGECGRTVKWE